MSFMTQDEVSASLFDEVKRLQAVEQELLQKYENAARQLVETREDLATKARALAECEHRAETAERNVERLQRKIDGIRPSVNRRAIEATLRRDDALRKLSEREAECERLRAELSANTQSLGRAANTIVAAMHERDTIRAQLAERDAEIGRLHGRLSERINEVVEVRIARSDLYRSMQADMDALRAALASANKCLSELEPVASLVAEMQDADRWITALAKSGDETRDSGPEMRRAIEDYNAATAKLNRMPLPTNPRVELKAAPGSG